MVWDIDVILVLAIRGKNKSSLNFSSGLYMKRNSVTSSRLIILFKQNQYYHTPLWSSFSFPNLASSCQYHPVILQGNIYSDFYMKKPDYLAGPLDS